VRAVIPLFILLSSITSKEFTVHIVVVDDPPHLLASVSYLARIVQVPPTPSHVSTLLAVKRDDSSRHRSG
jgi:hypothetical protein